MITYTSDGVRWHLFGKSTDEKPIDEVPNSSGFYEFDTKKVYMFDAETKTWIEQ